MRITIATPFWSHKETYPEFMFRNENLGRGYGAISGASPPLGSLNIAAILREEGHQVSVIDGIFYQLDKESWIKDVAKTRPDFVCLNAVSFYWKRVKMLAKDLKEKLPEIKVGVAGHHVTGIGPNAMMEEDAKSIDVAFLGESDIVSKIFLKKMEQGKLNEIETESISWGPQFVWKCSTVVWWENGHLKMMKKQLPPQNLDEFPMPARDLVPMEKYLPSIGFYKRKPHGTMFTSRGCPYTCSFCTALRSYRERSLDLVLEEIKELVEKYDVKDILFYDDMINLNRKRFEQFCKMLIEEKLDLIWAAQTRVNRITIEELKLMKKAGCWRILYGLETPSENLQVSMKKNIKTKQMIGAVLATKKAGIEVYGSFIIGFPGEKLEDMRRTVEFACRLPLDYTKFNMFTPYPDSRNFYEANNLGKFISDAFTQHHPVLVYDGVTKEQLEEMFRKSHLKFYTRPKYLIKRLLTIRSLEDVNRYYRGAMGFLWESIRSC